jgi:hypothetical protein
MRICKRFRSKVQPIRPGTGKIGSKQEQLQQAQDVCSASSQGKGNLNLSPQHDFEPGERPQHLQTNSKEAEYTKALCPSRQML